MTDICAWCEQEIPADEEAMKHADRCHTRLFPEDEVEVTLHPGKKPARVARSVWFPEHCEWAGERAVLERRRVAFLRDLRRRQGITDSPVEEL